MSEPSSVAGSRLFDERFCDEVSKQRLDADDFHAANRATKQVAEILFVAGEEPVCTGGDGTTGNGVAFFSELHSKVKKPERHPFHGTGKRLACRETLRHFRPHVSFGLGLRAGIREQNGVLFQFAQKVREKAFWERRGEQNVGIEEQAGIVKKRNHG